MSKIIVELDVDPGGKGQAAIKGVKDSLHGFEGGTQKAARGGTDLLAVFKGNLLADYFQRGTSAAVSFAATAIRASAEASDANSVLIFSATQAGIAYDTAASQAEDFGKRVGASNTEAARTYSQIIQLAERAGRPQDTDIIGKRFADLAAARGLKGAELSSLIGTILSGQDEGLNRLGIDDPGKLQAAYASQIGKTTEALTQMDKARAALNAVLEKGAAAEGESERRLAGTAGQLDSASAAYANLTTQLGNTITESKEFRDLLGAINEGLKLISTSADDVKKRLKEGLTPEEVAKEQAESTFNVVSDFVTTQAARVLRGVNNASRVPGGQGVLNYLGFSDEVIDQSVTGVAERRLAALTDAARAALKEVKDQEAKAAQNASKPPPVAAPDAAAAKKAAQEAQTAYKAALGFIDDIAARSSGKDNPFIKLFTEAETAAERMQERFGALGSEVVNQFTAMERKAIDVATATERIRHGLKAVELESQADALLKGYVGITAEMQRQLGIQQKQFDAATNVFKLRREAAAYERGFVPQNDAQQRREDQENYERVKRLRPQGTDEGARAGQKLIDEYILNFTKNLPVTAGTSPDPFTRQLATDRAGALNATASRFEAEVGDEAKRAEAGRYQIDLASRKLQELGQAAPGLDADVLRKEFLNITQALDPKELSGQLREAMGVALREEAQHERELEQEAREFRQQLVSPGGILVQIKEALDNLKPVSPTGALAQSPVNPGDDDPVVKVNARPAYSSRAAYEAAVFASDEERRGIEERDAREHGQGDPALAYRRFLGAAAAGDRLSSAPAGPTPAQQVAALLSNPKFHGDVRGLFTPQGTGNEVNPYAQAFFNARPGYSPANDPKAYDPSDPYAREFYDAGYFGSFRGSAARPPEPTAKLEGFIEKLAALVGEKGLKVDAPASNINLTVADGLEVTNAPGQAPRPETIPGGQW